MKCNTCKKEIEKGAEYKLYGKKNNYFCNEKCAEGYKKKRNAINFENNKWYRPKMKGFIHECCDCGLKHRVDFKIFPEDKIAPIEFKWTRINKEL